MGLKIKALMCGTAAFALAACEAGETGGTNQANAYAFSDYGDGLSSFQALGDASLAAPSTLASDLPSGSATYDGVMSVTLSDLSDGVLGTVRLNVGFDSNSLSGTASSFVTVTDQVAPGSLSITSGITSPIGPAVGTANVNGTIDFGTAGPLTINQTYNHFFSGDDGGYNSGVVINGTAQPTVGGPVDITSAWTVERQ